MAALRSRCGHYIFALWFLSIFRMCSCVPVWQQVVVDIVFTTYSLSNPGHLVPCTLDNAGTILFSQTSDMNSINATLLLVHFLIMSRPNISCVRFMLMSMYFMILLSVLVFYLWSPYGIGRPYIFSSCDFYLSSFFLLLSFFSSPNLSGHRLDLYHTSTHGVALVRI